MFRASSRGRSRPGAPLKVIRRVSGRISGRRYCEGCSGSDSERYYVYIDRYAGLFLVLVRCWIVLLYIQYIAG